MSETHVEIPIALDRTLLAVEGPEARSFLQGLLTQNVANLATGSAAYAALLSPQGKVVADMFVWATGPERLVLDLDAARGAEVLRRLTLFKLRAQVTLANITAGWAAASVQTTPPSAPDTFSVVDPRFPKGAMGMRVLAPRNAFPMNDNALAYEARRMAVGAPDLAHDAASEEPFALEALLEELNGVDFHKGCFVGQENVSRMKRRATTRKKFCPVAFSGLPPSFGAPILAGAAEIGSVRTGAPGRAIAFLRLDRAREALDKGTPLTTEGREVRLDPPSWLIMPAAEQEGER